VSDKRSRSSGEFRLNNALSSAPQLVRATGRASPFFDPRAKYVCDTESVGKCRACAEKLHELNLISTDLIVSFHQDAISITVLAHHFDSTVCMGAARP
jgi:hypothetical protein